MEPLISICIEDSGKMFAPGDPLRFECQVDAVAPEDISAIETSVLWRTEGKGDEDMGVHFFSRRTAADGDPSELLALQQFETELPRSPLSYLGVILKIHWSVRVRVFVKSGKDWRLDAPFQLGELSPVALIEAEEEASSADEDAEPAF